LKLLMPPIRALAASLLLVLASCVDTDQDIHYIPTPESVVDEMLRLAELQEGDLLYDLGSGDGRIPIAAARDYGVRAIGIEIDARLVERARRNARRAGVDHLVEFRQEDLFATDLRDANVVALYLGDTLNLRLRPKLLEELEPGARVVSHAFGMGGWIPDTKKTVANRQVYKWTVPKTFIPGLKSE
jgi:precorrin-6B methylase 2